MVGIATDGDADRLGIIDEAGHYVSSNLVLVLLYYYLLKYKGWKGAAVRNLSTTHLLDRVAAAYDQPCIEVPVGFKYISEAMDQHNALIGGESSGGLTVRGHFSGKDGLYAASLLVEMICVTNKPLTELIKEVFSQFRESHTVERDWSLTPQLKEKINRTVMVERQLPDYRVSIEKVTYIDGCKVYFANNGWLTIRFSGTEPRVRIFSEYSDKATAERLVQTTASWLGIE